MNSIPTLARMAGGRMKNGRLNFGWIPPDERSYEQEKANTAAVAEMPTFKILGRSKDVEKVFLTELWKHPKVVDALGFEYPGNHQFTGSCVGVGGGNTCFSVITVEAITKGEPEKIVIPFWPLPYGRSRLYMGEDFPGEGSLGGTFAKAIREDGILDAAQEGLPPFKNRDGLEWGEPIEIAWSDGDARQTLDLLEQSRKHVIKTTAECRNSDDVRDAIINGFACTCASTWGGNGLNGRTCRTAGTPEVLINDHVDEWGHQMSVHNFWAHPTLNEIFWIQNTWGKKIHGTDPAGGPPGGFWVLKKDIDWICRNGEVFAFSQFAGFPAQNVEWDWRGRL